jgi:hypothetical protein
MLRSFARVASALPNPRLSRFEDTQITWRELDNSFDRVHGKFDEIQALMNVQFNELSKKLAEGNQKLDLILLHITEQHNSYQ